MKRAMFRADASPAIGGGHVMRCLTLADELRFHGWKCIFSCAPETIATVPALRASGHDIIGADEKSDYADVLIVDHYGLNRGYEEKCRAQADKIVVLDDLADRPHDCDLLMDQTLGRDASDYKSLVPAHCRILTGPAYALLRPQFATARPAALARRQKQAGRVERILVMMGAADKDNVTGLVLSGLEMVDGTLSVDVILGAGAPHLKTVESQSRQSRHKVAVHVDMDDVAAAMADADLCIGAGGTSSWERCCMGLPALVIELADNQRKIIRELESAGAIRRAGQYQSLMAADIAGSVQRLIKEPERIVSMGAAAAGICDGRGAIKLVHEIEKLIREVNDESFATVTVP